MTMVDGPARTTRWDSVLRVLARSCHLGPTVAVTLLALAYAVSVGLDPARMLLVTAAVLAGQLSVGWSNDLMDRHRDRVAGRHDKPLAVCGDVMVRAARTACGCAIVAAVVLSLACGLIPGLIHLVGLAAAWSYNAGIKSTVLSWLPYAIGFAALPVFVTLTDNAGNPWWGIPVAGALLGVGAHLLNVLPDLDDDAATGVRGLAHRLGARRSTGLAVTLLIAGTVVLAVAAAAVPVAALVAVGGVVAALSVLAVVGQGKLPFRAAIGIALVDVVLLVIAA